MRTEALDVGRAHLGHGQVDLVSEDAERPRRAGATARHHAIKRGPAHEHELCPQTQGDDHIRAAADAAVVHHRHLVADGGMDGGQHLDRRRRPVQLACAMVRHHDAVDTHGRGAGGIVGMHDALEHELAGPQPP